MKGQLLLKRSFQGLGPLPTALWWTYLCTHLSEEHTEAQGAHRSFSVTWFRNGRGRLECGLRLLFHPLPFCFLTVEQGLCRSYHGGRSEEQGWGTQEGGGSKRQMLLCRMT